MAERQSAPRTRGNAFQNDMADALNRIAVLERRLGNVSGYSGGGGGGSQVFVRTSFGGLPVSAAIGDIGIVDAGGAGTWAHVYYWTGSQWERTAYPVSAVPGNQITATHPDGLYVAASGGGGGDATFIDVDGSDRLVGPSSTAEAALSGMTIPPMGVAGANQVLVVECFGDIFNNTGANQAFTWRIRFNTTLIHTSSANNISTDPARRRWHARIVLMVTAADTGYISVFQTMTAPASTEWNPMGANNNLMGGRELSGIFDWSTGGGFGFNLMGQWSASNANLEARGQSAYAYILG